MGFLKDRKNAKELENTYNQVSAFRKKMEQLTLEDSKLDIQATYDKCEELLTKIASAKEIVKEDLNKSRDVLMNSWFATRDALAYEYNIHQKRLAYLETSEKELSEIKNSMLQNGAQPKNQTTTEPSPEPGN
ncbi:MAG: hypothetical protein IJX17_05225 [Clostridia bacterium]|nr:hypothetical protein [Clostridia bacterium]